MKIMPVSSIYEIGQDYCHYTRESPSCYSNKRNLWIQMSLEGIMAIELCCFRVRVNNECKLKYKNLKKQN